MTEPSTVAAAGSMYAPSPGALLRRARQAQGLHIAALAAALKVNPRKLEQLEGDQFDQLPDVAFARALAQAVCRHLKIDAQPVLALLPVAATAQPALERVTMGLNTPFREYSQRHESGEWPAWLQARIVIPALLLLAAVAFLLVPKRWMEWVPPISWPWHSAAGTEPGSASGNAAGSASNGTVVENLPLQGQSAVVLGTGAEAVMESASAPAEAAVPVSPAASAAALPDRAASTPALAAAPPVPSSAPLPAGMLALRAAAESWVQVTDEAGDTLISRQLAAGEAVALNGVAPLRLTIGNAEGMQVRFKGRPVTLRLEPDHTARAVLK
jgi:cytoskeleton protein RodZ